MRTSFIVGFPGETEADFEELLALRARPRSSTTSGVFTFSDEEGTTSFDLTGRVPPRDEGGPQAPADGAAEEDRGPPQPRAGWGSASRCWSRAPTRTPTCCSGPARHARPRRSTAASSSTTAPPRAGRLRDLPRSRRPTPYDLVARIVAVGTPKHVRADASVKPLPSPLVALVSLSVPARGVAPEWARPTLFFGEHGAETGEAVEAVRGGGRAGDGRPGLRARGRRGQARPGRLRGAPVRGQGGRDRARRPAVGLGGGLRHPRRRGSHRVAPTPSRSPRPAWTGRSRGKPTTAASWAGWRKLSSYEPVEGRRHWTGRLRRVEDGVRRADPGEGGRAGVPAFPSPRSPTAAWKWSSRAVRGPWPTSSDSRSTRSAGRRTSTPR